MTSLNLHDQTSVPRRPWLAALLCLLSPGAGHLYVGRPAAAVAIFAGTAAASLALHLTLAFKPFSGKIYLALLLLIILGVYCFAMVTAWRAARRRPPDDPIRLHQRVWFVVLAAVLAGWAVSALQKKYVFETVHVPGDAMSPTLLADDYVMTTKVGAAAAPARGAVITFNYARPGEKPGQYIKRVVAVGGDKVEILMGVVSVNDTVVSRSSHPGISRFLMVPEDEVFVVGDNAEQSGVDSRFIGTIAVKDITGRAQTVWYSPSWQRIGTML